jgi:hypothetical protein
VKHPVKEKETNSKRKRQEKNIHKKDLEAAPQCSERNKENTCQQTKQTLQANPR